MRCLLIALLFVNAQSLFSQTGNVGINTTLPQAHLDIHGSNTRILLTDDVSGTSSTITRYTNRLELSPPDIFQVSIGGFAIPHFLINSTGYIGMGTNSPAYPLTLQTPSNVNSWGFMHTNGTVFLGSFLYNTGVAEFGTRSKHPLYLFTNNIDAPPAITIEQNGVNVGIGTTAPANQLQIGSVGSSGYGGNQLALGNGTQATGIAQTNTLLQWYSTTDIALMPRGNGHGRVGINTTTPSCPLEVQDYALEPLDAYRYFSFAQNLTTGTFTPNVSIMAASNVWALEFDAFSDARIKDIIGTSNNTADLQTLNAIAVTDYTLKDKVKNGDRHFKKVIAQQVETVYPQVISRHTDFIPNVYRTAHAIKSTAHTWLLVFDSADHISPTAARLRIMTSGDLQMLPFDIVSQPSDHEVEIKTDTLNGDKIFVYGEEVNDFRTVDYEGLTTLNISATQELSKQLKKQQEQIALLTQTVLALQKKLKQYNNF